MSQVGTTVRQASDLPQHIVADEKHTREKGEKAYVATTVAKNWIEGVSIAKSANEAGYTRAYGVFKTSGSRNKFFISA